jgi:HlyD family secretion protein
MPRTLLNRIVLVLIVAAGLGALGWALWPRPVPADLATIARGTLEVTVEEEGITRIREIYTVSAPTTGKMLRAPHKVGDAVIQGQTVVAVFEPNDPAFLDIRTQRVNEAAVDAADAAVRLAEAQVKQAQSQLDFSQADLRRAVELAARQTIAERSLEKAKLDVATSEAAVAAAVAMLEVRRRELESARALLIQPGQSTTETATCCIQVRAPVSGRVLKILAESEQVVQAGTPLLELGNPDDLEIAIDLLSRDAVRVVSGVHARIESWGGEIVLNARVRHVEPTGFTKVSALGIEEQRVKAVLDFTDPPETRQRLGHGYRVVARIVVWHGDDLALVPLGALFRPGESWAVFVFSNGRARLRLIEIGERNLHAARIVHGLQEGEQVILHPSDRIEDGTRIGPRWQG